MDYRITKYSQCREYLELPRSRSYTMAFSTCQSSAHGQCLRLSCPSSTRRRGWIHLVESKDCGKLMGRARLVDCFELSESQFGKSRCHHCVRYLSEVPYKRMFAWVLNDAERFEKPFMYEHAQGAVIWVRLMPETKCGRPRSAGVRPL